MSPLRNSSHGTLWRYATTVSLGRRPAPKLQLRSRCYGAATVAASSRLVSPSHTFPMPKKRVKFATCFAGELWQEASEQKRWKVLNQRAEKSNNIPEKLKRKIQFLPFLDLATVDSRHQYIHSLGSSLGTISVMYWEESYFSFIKKSILPKAWLVIGRQSWQMRK